MKVTAVHTDLAEQAYRSQVRRRGGGSGFRVLVRWRVNAVHTDLVDKA